MANYWQKLQTQGKARKWFDSSTSKDTANTFYAIRVITDTVFADLDDGSTDLGGSGVLSGVTVPAGTEILGQFNDIDLTSGVIEAFSDSDLV